MRCIIFTLLLCNALLLKAQSLELEHWKIINSSEVTDNDADVSSLSYSTANWYRATVPTTVLNALVKEKVYPDPRVGLNNYQIPDVSDEFNEKMGLAKYNYLKSNRNPWQDPYWYRTETLIPASYKGKKVWLTLYGINYRADVWVNGHLVADKKEIVGMFRRFKLDITSYAKPGSTNCIAIKIYQVDHPGVPTPGTQLKVFGPVRGHSYDIFKDETLKMSGGWDCAPVVRDRNMGIYQKVTLDATEEVILQNPFVVTTLPQKSTSLADVNIRVEVKNTSDKKISARLDALITLVNEVKFPTYTKYMEGTLRPIRIAQNIMLNAGEKKTIEFSSKDFPSLLIKNPYLWYPNGYGKQYLHHMKLSVKLGNRVSDAKEFDFGIREVSTSLNRVGDEYGRVYFINGKRIFCKGGWIQPDMMLEESKKRIYDEARLMAEANINLISSEDMPSPSETWFESFDKYGLMWWHVFYQCFRMMPGTETANNPLDHDLAVNCVEDMMLRYRNHPSIVTWVGAVEVLMNENLYRKTKDKVNSLDTTRLYLSTTSHHWDVEGLTPYLKEEMPTGTTDDGGPDYNWAPSRYFFAKVQEVHLQMFRNELGMPSIPMYNSLKKFIPTAEDTTHVNSPIFPLDSIWAEHGAWDVSNYCYRSYDNAIRTLFGDPKNTKQYADNAQYINADGYRAMFEAANHRMWDITSGVMIWKLNSCWPDVCWQIYDWYLNPNAAYYFSKKAMEPVHIQLNANDFSISLINASHETLENVTVTAKVINNDMKVAWEHSQQVTVSKDCYKEITKVPQCGKYSYNYFVKLELRDKEGKLLSDNLYWFYSQHMDFFWFTSMEKPKLKEEVSVIREEDEYVVSVCLKNESSGLSHFNHLTLQNARGEEISPVFWSDNFITLFPGEKKVVTARVAVSDAGEVAPTFVLSK
ncbi:MAG: glycoside hydrolase family 2 TIM barrel-domain containing protein [Bacteroides sp.]|uniref:glycoside hydrolase family 2 protein n=3 Tax=Bacteroides sp. TaxID=29523 RepID=UPI002FCB54DE